MLREGYEAEVLMKTRDGSAHKQNREAAETTYEVLRTIRKQREGETLPPQTVSPLILLGLVRHRDPNNPYLGAGEGWHQLTFEGMKLLAVLHRGLKEK